MVGTATGRSGATAAGSSIAGGFVWVRVAVLRAAWGACQSKPLGVGDFRAWLACHELVARRCLAEPGRPFIYTIGELAGLLGVTEKRARATVRRLVAAERLEWSGSAIGFPERLPTARDPESKPAPNPFEDTIGRGEGSVAIPRRMLRYLAQGARASLIATALGHLFRCLSRRKEGFVSRGRIKASWVARGFGVDLRRVKAARRTLAAIGWIHPEPDDQRSQNRWGKRYRIDLDWDQPPSGSGRSLPPPPPAERPEIATPSVNQEPSLKGGVKNQEPASGGPAGVAREGPPENSEAQPTVPAEQAARTTRGRPPDLDNVRLEDLIDTERTLELHRQAVAKGLVGASEDGQLKFVAAAEHATAIGKGNPPGLFAYLIRNGCWRYLTDGDEDRANARIKAHIRGPQLPLIPPKPPSQPWRRPPLSDDALVVLRVIRALEGQKFRGDMFLMAKGQDPSWTQSRWDAAEAELKRPRP